MKPVQLIPVGAGSAIAAPVEIVPARPSSPNGAIGIIAGGVVAMLIAGYFEFATHSNAKAHAAVLAPVLGPVLRDHPTMLGEPPG